MPDFYDLDARRLMESYANDPVGTHRAISQELAAAGYQTSADDPRVAEMYEAWKSEREMEQYDQSIAEILNRPENSDLLESRIHQYVVAAEGDFQKAVELYRTDTAQVLDYYGHAPGAAPLPGETPGYTPDPNAAPRDNLHRAIEEAARASLARRR
jgi:hypothetical protein